VSTGAASAHAPGMAAATFAVSCAIDANPPAFQALGIGVAAGLDESEVQPAVAASTAQIMTTRRRFTRFLPRIERRSVPTSTSRSTAGFALELLGN